MKAIKLFVDFKFTSLSPDAKPISLGIVSGWGFPYKIPFAEFDLERLPFSTKESIKEINPEFIECIGYDDIRGEKVAKYQVNIPLSSNLSDATKLQFFLPEQYLESKSFYAEFSDFDINRCDDWVKENVVSKLKGVRNGEFKCYIENGFEPPSSSTVDVLIPELRQWLSQFSDYQIQFICDSKSDHGFLTWMKFVQLIGEWEEKIIDNRITTKSNGQKQIDYSVCPFVVKVGLPVLSNNISPVPFELNQLIAHKKGISVKEAFDLDREDEVTVAGVEYEKSNKHNALWDAKVMKAIYEKLMA
jgi:hypothetical protein